MVEKGPEHPQVVVHKQTAASTSLSSQLLELGTVCTPTLTAVSSDLISESLENMYWLIDQSHQLSTTSATADSAQTTGPSPTTTPHNISFSIHSRTRRPPERRLTTRKIYVAEIKSITPKAYAKATMPLDFARLVKGDRDPRTSSSQWPRLNR